MSAIAAAAMRVRTMADGSLRIEVEVSPVDAQAAFALFGRPGAPMALAALKEGYAAAQEPLPTIKESLTVEKPKGGALAKLSGMWCQDHEFHNWINGAMHNGIFWQCNGPNEAKLFVLEICQIDSRAELDHDERAAELFHRMVRIPFSAYLSRKKGC